VAKNDIVEFLEQSFLSVFNIYLYSPSWQQTHKKVTISLQHTVWR